MHQPKGNPGREEMAASRCGWSLPRSCSGVLSGAVSVMSGLRDSSLGVFAVGLGVLADVPGSAVLVWAPRRAAPAAFVIGVRRRAG